jgi:mRNA interferase RelE/StbE
VPDYTVVFTRSARKELQGLPLATARRILSATEKLGANPRPVGVKKLQGAKDLWRLRVGDYRVIYAIDDPRNLVDVRVVRHRKDVYR